MFPKLISEALGWYAFEVAKGVPIGESLYHSTVKFELSVNCWGVSSLHKIVSLVVMFGCGGNAKIVTVTSTLSGQPVFEVMYSTL